MVYAFDSRFITSGKIKTVQSRKQIENQAVRQVLSKIRQLAYKNYYSAKAYNHFLLWLSNLQTKESKEKLIVYQMGKVGSTTILRSLEALSLDIPIYQIHSLTQDTMDRYEEFYRSNWHKFPNATHLWQSQFLRHCIDKSLKSEKWKIVTLVRDPVARNISSFFQLLNRQPGFDYKQKINSTDIENTVEDLIKIFLEQFQMHELPLTWFDSELKYIFNIDVFSGIFPKSRGYEIYQGGYADVLLVRLESLYQCASEAFREFLGIDEFTLIEENIGSSKAYSSVYQKFIDSIVLPDSYIDQMYTSKYTQHFYSEAEISKFKAKWCKCYAQ